MLMFLLLASLAAAAFIPNHIWRNRDLQNYDKCFRKFGHRHAWDPSKENRDMPIRSEMRRLKGGFHMYTWPNGRVPYQLSNRVRSSDSLKRLACGLQFFHTKSCLQFVPKRRNDRNYIYIDKELREGCYSTSIGMRPHRAQKINLGGGCWTHATIIHELMHAIGFFHEQSRDDRDEYIRVNWDNIASDWKDQYWTSRRQGYIARLVGEYDYNSVMHYGRGASYGPGMTALKAPVNDNNNKMGNRYAPTQWDIWKINDLYSCSAEPERATRGPQGTTRRPTTQACYDISPYCSKYDKSKCNSEKGKKKCRKTCRHCTPSSVCKDTATDCHLFKNLERCYLSDYIDKRCQKSCAHCDCRDVYTNCHINVHLCTEDERVDQWCKKSCGHC